MKMGKIRIISLIFFAASFCLGQEISADEVMERVYSIQRPNTSIMEIKLEITRTKRNKEKIKVREYTRYEK